MKDPTSLINGIPISSTNKVKVLVVAVETDLISNVCNTANSKTSAPSEDNRIHRQNEARALCYAYRLSHLIIALYF